MKVVLPALNRTVTHNVGLALEWGQHGNFEQALDNDLAPTVCCSWTQDLAAQFFATSIINNTHFDSYKEELRTAHDEKLNPLLNDKAKMTNEHRSARASLKEYQKKRWQSEELKRSARVRKGFKGIWDKLNGRYWKTRKANEQEAWQAHMRDRKQQEELIQQQLTERQNLQTQIGLLRDAQEKERQALVRDLSHVAKHEEKSKHAQRSKTNTKNLGSKNHETPNRQNKRDGDKDFDFEPEI